MSWRKDPTEITISGCQDYRAHSAICIAAPPSHHRDPNWRYDKPEYDYKSECQRIDHRLYRAMGLRCPCYEQSYIIIKDVHEPISHNQYCTETHWQPKKSEIHVHPDDILFIEPGEMPLSIRGLFREVQQLRRTVTALEQRLSDNKGLQE